MFVPSVILSCVSRFERRRRLKFCEGPSLTHLHQLPFHGTRSDALFREQFPELVQLCNRSTVIGLCRFAGSSRWYDMNTSECSSFGICNLSEIRAALNVSGVRG